MFYYDMYAFYAVGRKAICNGPEGNMIWAGRHCVMGLKAICYGSEGISLWAGRRYVLERKVEAWKGVYVVGILGVSH